MGDVLAGFHAAWEFESDSVLIRFERGIRTPKLFQALGERRIPHEAISAVTVTAGKRGTVALHLMPRPGADPLMEAAAGQLKESSDPYRLVLPAERETLASYYADELRPLVHGTQDDAPERYLVAAPEAPMQFKAYDGKAAFDGKTVSFRWFWTGASSAKWKAGDQSFLISDLVGVEWRSPELFEGHLRLVHRDPSGTAADRPERADQDPASVVFGLGYGLVHESLPFAASVLGALRSAPAPDGTRADGTRPAAAAARRDPADVAERIRHLADLHEAGLVTDEEFTEKKAQLLAEL